MLLHKCGNKTQAEPQRKIPDSWTRKQDRNLNHWIYIYALSGEYP